MEETEMTEMVAAETTETIIYLRYHTHAQTKANQRFPTHIGQVTEMPMTFHI
jgi:hypothetical protein